MKTGGRKVSGALVRQSVFGKMLENKRGGCRVVYGHCVCPYFYLQILMAECKLGIWP